jgi:hypothetical protein
MALLKALDGLGGVVLKMRRDGRRYDGIIRHNANDNLPQSAPFTMIRQLYVWGEAVKRSMEWLIKRLIKVGARVSYHARRWYVHVASAFPLAHHYRAVLAWGP